MSDNTQDPLKLAREAYLGSTSYFDASIRGQIEADLRQFQGLHPRGSKYMADVNKSRSRLFRPKTRGVIRKNEAVAAEAFFSTLDTMSVSALDDSDERHQASAEVMQRLIQHRLTKTIPWFLTCIGAYQDALVTGTVISYQCWEYDKKRGIDRPKIKLLPIENCRFDPGADWTDPVNTSPYWIELVPMYVKDVKARMQTVDSKTGEPKWIKCDDSEIMQAAKAYGDTTRLQREQGRTDSKDQNQTITDFSIVWVHKNIVEIDGEDMLFYTLGTTKLLSKPVPLKERYAHGRRPYVLGGAIIETHKNYWSGLPRIGRDIQAEINDLANLRIDNVRFVMSKRYFVKRNKQVDIRSLMRNVPGAATLMDDPEKDVKVVDFNDVTGSAYQEQDRLNLDFDDITGSFSGSSVQSNRKLNETVGGMQLLDGSANQVTGYQLRTFVETWVEPVLRQLILLEQYYETDEVILALAGRQANLVDKFGIDAITDDLLMQELTLNVNVGMGNTNPKDQVKNFMQAMQSLRDLLQDGILEQRGLKIEEVVKELFGKLGYRDGARFFDMETEDPQVQQLKAQLQEMMGKLQQKEDPELTKAKIELARAQAKSAEIKDENVMADTIAKKVAAMFSAMQAGEVVTAVPQVAPVADKMLGSAGFAEADVPTGDPATGLAINSIKRPKTGLEFTPGGQQMQGPTEGMQQGIETPAADSVGMANGGLVGAQGQPLEVDPVTGLFNGVGGTFAASSELTPEQNARQNAVLEQRNKALYPEAYGAKANVGLGSYVNGGMVRQPVNKIGRSLPEKKTRDEEEPTPAPTPAPQPQQQAQATPTPTPRLDMAAMPAGGTTAPQAAPVAPEAQGGVYSLGVTGASLDPAPKDDQFGFANGGAIAGPGTPTSDSIPAVVDGTQPAAVSSGEYHIPAAVVDMFGLDFFEELLRRYHVPVEGEPQPDPSVAPVSLQSGDFIVPADVVAALGKDFFDQLIAQAGGQQ